MLAYYYVKVSPRTMWLWLLLSFSSFATLPIECLCESPTAAAKQQIVSNDFAERTLHSHVQHASSASRRTDEGRCVKMQWAVLRRGVG